MPRGIPLTPEQREEARKLKNAKTVAWRKRRIAEDPAFHERIKEKWRAWYARKGAPSVKAAVNKFRVDNPQRYYFQNKKSSAKGSKHEWALEFGDITWPTHCPALGIEIKYGHKGNGMPADDSPSMDRIDNSRGYVKGNIIIVSQLANRIKTSATPAQIRAVADFYDLLANGQREM